MMFKTMNAAGLYPPIYFTRATTGRDAVQVLLLNEHRPSIWDQVATYLEEKGTIGNAEVRKIMGTEDILAASKAIKIWVDRGLLEIANPEQGKRVRRYRLSEVDTMPQLFSIEKR